MKKLIVIFLMLSLLICILPCFASASTAPTDNEDQAEEVTIVSTYINDDGELILVMSDGTERNAGATEEVGQESDGEKTFFFTPGNFVSNLYYMGVGMVGIFLVIGIIVLATVLLNRAFSGKAKE
jgi:Na+-transporting methylmalonyl-CoA/oxaloacetate decarboxylase gamma subunit